MALTSQQQAIVKAYIAADPTLNSQPSDGDGLGVIRDHLNSMSSPVALAWNSETPVDNLNDTIDRSKFTPTDAADTTTVWTNRCLAAQTKMMAIDGLLFGRQTINAEKATIRASIRDALIQLPTGAGGALTSASGANAVNALTACTKNTTVIQRLLLAVGSVTTGSVTAGIIGYVGPIDSNEVDAARRS
jgi:hypothetical protein